MFIIFVEFQVNEPIPILKQLYKCFELDKNYFVLLFLIL